MGGGTRVVPIRVFLHLLIDIPSVKPANKSPTSVYEGGSGIFLALVSSHFFGFSFQQNGRFGFGFCVRKTPLFPFCMRGRLVTLRVTLVCPYPKLDLDASTASYPSQTSTIQCRTMSYHTIHINDACACNHSCSAATRGQVEFNGENHRESGSSGHED